MTINSATNDIIPLPSTAWRILANADEAIGNFDKAIEALQKWATSKPKFAAAQGFLIQKNKLVVGQITTEIVGAWVKSFENKPAKTKLRHNTLLGIYSRVDCLLIQFHGSPTSFHSLHQGFRQCKQGLG